MLVIGGGATGAGVAVDAASRGLKTALVEKYDFSSGTSSRSTKLIHGGVRYLQKAIMEFDLEQVRMLKSKKILFFKLFKAYIMKLNTLNQVLLLKLIIIF